MVRDKPMAKAKSMARVKPTATLQTGAILFFKRFYLFIHERHTHTQRQRHRHREKPAPYREPDMGLDPGTPGSCPGLKAGAKTLSHAGIPGAILNALLS